MNGFSAIKLTIIFFTNWEGKQRVHITSLGYPNLVIVTIAHDTQLMIIFSKVNNFKLPSLLVISILLVGLVYLRAWQSKRLSIVPAILVSNKGETLIWDTIISKDCTNNTIAFLTTLSIESSSSSNNSDVLLSLVQVN